MHPERIGQAHERLRRRKSFARLNLGERGLGYTGLPLQIDLTPAAFLPQLQDSLADGSPETVLALLRQRWVRLRMTNRHVIAMSNIAMSKETLKTKCGPTWGCRAPLRGRRQLRAAKGRDRGAVRIGLVLLAALVLAACGGKDGAGGQEKESQKAAPRYQIVESAPQVAHVDDESALIGGVPGETCRNEGEVLWGVVPDPKTGKNLAYCGVAWTIARSVANDSGKAVHRERHVVVPEGASKDQLKPVLAWHYQALRAAAAEASPEVKKVFVYVYPSEARANAGTGGWIAMTSEIGQGSLPARFDPQFKMPAGDAPDTTIDEDQLYDELLKAFANDPPASPDDEKRVMSKVAKKHGISVKELDTIYTKVMVRRQGGG